MSKLSSEKAAKLGDLLFRYMRARHHFKDTVDRPLPAHELTALIEGGKAEFDEVYLEPDANPPIVFDGKADEVYEALIKKRYRAIPFCGAQLVAVWRHYVINDGPMPRQLGSGSSKLATDRQTSRGGVQRGDSPDLDLKTTR